jgi:hypothetical protein
MVFPGFLDEDSVVSDSDPGCSGNEDGLHMSLHRKPVLVVWNGHSSTLPGTANMRELGNQWAPP